MTEWTWADLERIFDGWEITKFGGSSPTKDKQVLTITVERQGKGVSQVYREGLR